MVKKREKNEKLLFLGKKMDRHISSGEGVRWGWVFLEQTPILNGFQFTMCLIAFVVVETKQFRQ